MARLSSFFQTEMARTAGSMAPTTRKALEMARQSGEEFSVEQFCRWLIDAGVPGPEPGVDPKAFMKRLTQSVNTRVRKLAADPEAGERPSALKPLVATRAGRTGPGGGGLFRYVYDGAPGVPLKGVAKPKPDETDDDIPYADDEEGGEFSDAPDEPPAAPKAKMPPGLLPKADDSEQAPMASQTMADLAQIGFGEDNEIWPQIAKAENDVAVQKIMAQSGVPNMVRPGVIRVAKYIFNRLAKDWETGGVAAPEPAALGAGDRKYDKGGSIFKKKAAEPAAAPPPPPPQAAADDDEDDGEFLDPDDEVEPSTPSQAGAANFVKPSAPPPVPAPKAATPAAAKPAGASVKNIANLMKKFKK